MEISTPATSRAAYSGPPNTAHRPIPRVEESPVAHNAVPGNAALGVGAFSWHRRLTDTRRKKREHASPEADRAEDGPIQRKCWPTCMACKKWWFRLENMLTVPFFLLLAVTVSILTPVTYTLSLRSRGPLLAGHEVIVEMVNLEQNLRSQEAYELSVTTAALLDNRTAEMPPERGVPMACGMLDKGDFNNFVRSFSIILSDLGTVYGCAHGDVRLPTMRTLVGAVTMNKTAGDLYRIDPTTYFFQEPLELYNPARPSAKNLSYIFGLLRDTARFPVVRALYSVRAGNISEIPPTLYWGRTTDLPNVLFFNYPFFTYTTEEDRRLGRKDGITYTEVRLETRLFATSGHFNSNTTSSRLIALSPLTVMNEDPVVWSNNWGQEVVDRPWAMSTTYDAPDVTQLRVSHVDDGLMQQAVKHIHFSALQTEGASQTTRITYNGAFAYVTAWRHTTPLGMVSCFVLVTPARDLVGRTFLLDSITGGVVAAVVLLLTVSFRFFIGRTFSEPLRELADVMQGSAKKRKRTMRRMTAGYGSRYLRFTEIEALLSTYNDSIRQIAEIDKFVLRDLITSAQTRTSICSKEDYSGSETWVTSRTSYSSDDFTVGASATASQIHVARTALLTVTSVYLIVYLPKYDATAQRHAARERRRQKKQKHNAQTAGLGTSYDVVSALTSSELEAYLSEVYRLAERYGGYAQIVSPEVCAVYFCRQAVRALDNAQGRADANATVTEQLMGVAVKRDAMCGAQFALQVNDFWERERRAACAAKRVYPLTTAVVDTQMSPCIFPESLVGSLSVSPAVASRSVAFDLLFTLPVFRAPVVVTEETVVLVQDGVRVLPMEAMQVGSTDGRVAYGVVLYEALPGRVCDGAWQQYAACFGAGFAYMLQGNYRGALEAFDATLNVRDVEVGLLPAEERRGRVLQLHAQYGPHLKLASDGARTHQLDRLMGECTRRILSYDSTAYVRRPLPMELLHKLHQHRCPTPVVRAERRRLAGAASSTAGAGGKGPLRLSFAGGPAGRRANSGAGDESDGDERSWTSSDSMSSRSGGGAGGAGVGGVRGLRGATAEMLRVEQFHRDLQTRLLADEALSAAGTGVDPGDEAALIAADARAQLRLRTSVSDIGMVITYTARMYVVDAAGKLWVVGSRSLGDRHSESVYRHKYPTITENGTLAAAELFLLKSLALDPSVVAQCACVEDLPVVEKTTEDVESAAKLFPEQLMSEHTVGYLSHSVTVEGGLVAITEYYPGGNLREMMVRYGRTLPERVIARYMASMLAGLQFLHGEGVVHGDVRPENVLVGTEGRGKLRGFFGDYALAQRLLVRFPSCYVSPEVACGDSASAASDVYAAGLCLVEMVTSRLPWRWAPAVQVDHSPAELEVLARGGGCGFRDAVRRGDVIPCEVGDDADGWIRDVLRGCLCRRPEDRMTAAALLDLLS